MVSSEKEILSADTLHIHILYISIQTINDVYLLEYSHHCLHNNAVKRNKHYFVDTHKIIATFSTDFTR